MGNCTSKKSGKLSKLRISKAMDKEPLAAKGESRGLAKKIAPCSKGQTTSFGFKKRPASALPAPVTLSSRLNEVRQDGQSGSSIESLCHVPHSNSTALTQKKTSTPSPSTKSTGSNTANGGINRFGFRSATPPRINKVNQSSDTPSRSTKSPTTRSKSEGPRELREAFFRETMLPAGSAQSGLNSSRACMSAGYDRFQLQTSQLPRPQYAIRFTDKNFKTVTNYSRREGPVDSSLSKEVSLTDDSGVGSQPGSNAQGETDTLLGLELSDSSPAPNRSTVCARKLEMRMVNANKFELLDKGRSPSETCPQLMKAPRSSICTGLVQQRTEQYLLRLAGVKDSNRLKAAVHTPITSPHEGIESEEEKLSKDASRSEKARVTYLMTEGAGENDELLPGEAMAEDISLTFSSDEDSSSYMRVNKTTETADCGPSHHKIAKNDTAIRVDALKLSNQLKNNAMSAMKSSDSSYGLLSAGEKAALYEDTLLELSSESDSLEGKDSNVEKEKDELNASTESPGTPSNASLSEGRDFLIDDEIADQPQLCFSTHEDIQIDKTVTGSGNNNGSEGIILVGNPDTVEEVEEVKVVVRERRSSVGTLSPCESLMSDDLIMDFENAAEDFCDRTNGKGLGRASSAGSSPASHKSVVSRASTEEDLSVKLDKTAYQHMFHDIVSIKSMLLKLNRVLTESDVSVAPCTEDDPAMDLKKQVAFLQQQLLQREAALQSLQNQVNKSVDKRSHVESKPSCNAATQTDRVRPSSTGPSLLQNLPSDSNNLVSNRSTRKTSESLDENTRVTVIRTAPSEKTLEDRQQIIRAAPADKIMEKVKELSFKPVEVLEREKAERRAIKGRNVFKITKIDLVLKSDNYGQSELRQS